jgi:hypothetical protein
MHALSCWVNAEDRWKNVLLWGKYTWVPGLGVPASRPRPCVLVRTPRLRTPGRGSKVYLGEGFVHVPCYDTSFEEGMAQRGRLWGGRVVPIGGRL